MVGVEKWFECVFDCFCCCFKFIECFVSVFRECVIGDGGYGVVCVCCSVV